ncbi:MAG: S8 family serine peptidase [Planctomycetaceae bacterium]
MTRPLRTARRPAAGHRLGVEGLERRSCPAAIGLVAWEGAMVPARADTWIVRSERPLAAMAEAGWRTERLGTGLELVVAPGVSPGAMQAWAAGIDGVAGIEPDVAIRPTAVPNDPSFREQWGLRNTGQSGGTSGADIAAVAAWDVTTGSRSVVVAVIDSGFDYTHPDLAANVWRNPGEVPGDGIDNDGNGFVDDVHGWDFANDDADPMDDDGHGTHVAGTIGAVGDNGVGVTGVAWQVSIMGLKFLDSEGNGYTSDAIAAISYATRMRREFGVNVVATNNSWGGGDRSLALRAAIADGSAAGILFVTAAGNDGINGDRRANYPANEDLDAVITVTATNRDNRLPSFANYGPVHVDLAAPGVAIRSTIPGGSYATYSGTSMATPHVTGTIALLAAANPAASATAIRGAILSTTTRLPALAGKTVTGGLLDAAAAVRAIQRSATPPTPPQPPTASVVRPARDVGDTIAKAYALARQESGAVRLAARIGDGIRGLRDVDVYRIRLAAGQQVTIDVDARSLATTSLLDSTLRLFDAAGRQLASNGDVAGSADSLLSFTARTTGTYYVGVSGAGNDAYAAKRAGSGRTGSTGIYELTLTFGRVGGLATTGIHSLGFLDESGTGALPVGRRPKR